MPAPHSSHQSSKTVHSFLQNFYTDLDQLSLSGSSSTSTSGGGGDNHPRSGSGSSGRGRGGGGMGGAGGGRRVEGRELTEYYSGDAKVVWNGNPVQPGSTAKKEGFENFFKEMPPSRHVINCYNWHPIPSVNGSDSPPILVLSISGLVHHAPSSSPSLLPSLVPSSPFAPPPQHQQHHHHHHNTSTTKSENSSLMGMGGGGLMTSDKGKGKSTDKEIEQGRMFSHGLVIKPTPAATAIHGRGPNPNPSNSNPMMGGGGLAHYNWREFEILVDDYRFVS